MSYFDLPFDSNENISGESFVVATYLVSGIKAADALRAAGRFAVGQSVGTWVALPGVTRFMIENYQARVLALYPIPCQEDTTTRYVMSVAFPLHNFGDSFAMMQTALIGNDVSTALRIKLLDLSLTGGAIAAFSGPQHGVGGIRQITGIADRPLVLNMIKPCIGHDPEEGAELFFEAGMGGVDLIKDDEVLSDTPVSSACRRARANNQAAERVFEATGKRPIYIPNITGKICRMRERAEAVIEAGCHIVMINYVTAGLDALQEIAEDFGSKLAILGHYAGCGMLNTDDLGYADSVLLGTLSRLAGADMVMTMYPSDTSGPKYLEYLQTIQKQKLPIGHIKPVLTAVGGGVTPLNIGRIVDEVGRDVVLGIGGAIQGHPMGARAGAQAVMRALDSRMKNITLEEAAEDCPALRTAMDNWN